jgi:coenzyme F420-0:L-glutamate ligase/coenzyme F420-1:gamma-L-glutamate ligase
VVSSFSSQISIFPVRGIGEVNTGDEIGEMIFRACESSGLSFAKGDIVVVTQKVVSKAEGRVVKLSDVRPSRFALLSARKLDKDPRVTEIVLSESRRIVKMVRGLILVETRHGFVCANAGVDQSNVKSGTVTLLPVNPDKSARKIRETIRSLAHVDTPVIVSDTFGRPWREGQTDVAIGISGLSPLEDYRGRKDSYGYELKATVIAVADEIASAAELVMGKLSRVPAVVVRGYNYRKGEESAKVLVRKPSRDLFR